MSKISTLVDNRAFIRAYSKGKSFVSPGLVTYINKNKIGNLRIGITTSKKVGNAVQRSRCRRIIREAYYKLSPEIKDIGVDIVFVARNKTVYLKSTDIYRYMKKQLQSAGMLE